MADELTSPNIIVELTVDEGTRLKEGIEKCFQNQKIFTEKEMEGLERAYDVLMGLE